MIHLTANFYAMDIGETEINLSRSQLPLINSVKGGKTERPDVLRLLISPCPDKGGGRHLR
jgi:hypothetical protein